jgi:uncharacterized coiled-coil protein SlyX
MSADIDLDSMTIEDLVDLNERVQKKLSEKLAAEKAELDRRQAALAKLTDRVAGKKPPRAPTRPKADASKDGGAGSKEAKDSQSGGAAQPQAASPAGGGDLAGAAAS